MDNIKADSNDNLNKNLTKSLEENIMLFQGIFANDETLIIRRFQNKHLPAAKCCVVYFDGMIKSDRIYQNVIEPILRDNLSNGISTDNLLDELLYKVIESNNITNETDMKAILEKMIYGDTLFLLEGYDRALIMDSKGWQTRAVSEPESERVVRGPREGFTESIMINISLIRRKIRNPALKIKFKEIGRQTRTSVCICYLETIASPDILKELEKRLDEIDIDSILDSGYIQELIRDAPFSPFETVGTTERPDAAAGKLLEGRFAIIVDGSPIVLTVPYLGVEAVQSSEDYYTNYIFSSINRFIRASASIIAICLPAVYIALTTFHQEMLPTPLLVSISASRKGIPFPTAFSIAAMMIVFDLLREAGARMPAPIGQAINIVGTLVLGQAVAEAKLISAPVIIVTALTGILTLINIRLLTATIVGRLFLIFTASILGIYGFIIGLLLILLHLMSLRSFGVPYMLNITSIANQNGQDIWVRAPWWSMTLRPKIIAARNLTRQPAGKVRGK